MPVQVYLFDKEEVLEKIMYLSERKRFPNYRMGKDFRLLEKVLKHGYCTEDELEILKHYDLEPIGTAIRKTALTNKGKIVSKIESWRGQDE